MNNRRILIIAGSDSSGGAGLEADQKVAAAQKCYAMTATTALTAQNTLGVQDIHVTSSAFVRKQIAACLDDIGVDAVKTGMLACEETIKVVADSIREYEISAPLIVDPVMASTSGSQLLPDDAIATLRSDLLPLATVLTPNIPESNLLVGRPKDYRYTALEDLLQLIKELHQLGPRYVLLKGGHLWDGSRVESSQPIVDLLYDGNDVIKFEKPFIKSRNTHGTGCSLATAIACYTTFGFDIPEAVKRACNFVEAGIKLSIDRGKGSGPINHFHSLYSLPFAPGHFVDYLISRTDVRDLWHNYTEHRFVLQLQDGTLALSDFKAYLIQDYLFLTEFARAKALSASKIRQIEGIIAEAETMLHIHREMNLHITYCKSLGLSKEQIENAMPAPACLAYTSYLHDVGHSEDWFALQIAFAPCLLGYGMIARRLYDSKDTLRGEKNLYWRWIENYVAEDYTDAVKKGREVLEESARNQSPHRLEQLVQIFRRAVMLETGFWDMGSTAT